MTPLNTILLGYDGSADSQRAFDWAAATARSMGSELRVVVASETRSRTSHERRRWSVEGAEAVRDEAQARLAAAEGITGSVDIVDGPAADVLLDAAPQAGLVVLGARGYGAISGALMGSVSQQLTRHAPCPVAVIREPLNADATAVAVGVDDSPDGGKALEFAFELASLEGRTLIAAHGWGGATEGASDFAAAEAATERTLAPWRAKYPNVQVTPRTVSQAPVDALADASEQVALVVVGSRGRGAMAGLWLGSVGQTVLQRAQCPVVIAR